MFSVALSLPGQPGGGRYPPPRPVESGLSSRMLDLAPGNASPAPPAVIPPATNLIDHHSLHPRFSNRFPPNHPTDPSRLTTPTLGHDRIPDPAMNISSQISHFHQTHYNEGNSPRRRHTMMCIRDYLQSRHVWFETLLHAPAPSATKLAQSVHVSGRQVAKGSWSRRGEAYVLAVLPATHRIDLDRLARVLDGRPVSARDRGRGRARLRRLRAGRLAPVRPALRADDGRRREPGRGRRDRLRGQLRGTKASGCAIATTRRSRPRSAPASPTPTAPRDERGSTRRRAG